MSSKQASAIAIAPRGAGGSFRVLVERLTGIGFSVAVVDDIASAAELCEKTPAALPCILVDLTASTTEIEDVTEAAEMIRRTVAAIPYAFPVAVTNEANVALIIACLRAGAGDAIDIQAEGTAVAKGVVQRIYTRQLERTVEAHTSAQLRTMIEDLLKDLIQTERRSIDLEARLARTSGEVMAIGPDMRQPAILLVDDDRRVADKLADLLEQTGVATFAYISGEDAVRDAEASDSDFDLALVAAQLPGIDGLETIRRLRQRFAGLPAFLMSSVHDADLAANAADLGVVGFVEKPLDDLREIVTRLGRLARESLQRTRERAYLDRIKARHEHVLARYRSLPRQA